MSLTRIRKKKMRTNEVRKKEKDNNFLLILSKSIPLPFSLAKCRYVATIWEECPVNVFTMTIYHEKSSLADARR